MSAQPAARCQPALPEDAQRATLVGRAWVPGRSAGPEPGRGRWTAKCSTSPTLAATSSELLNARDPLSLLRAVRAATMRRIGGMRPSCSPTAHTIGAIRAKPYLLAPVDLQAVRACGVTFIASMLERVIEEQAHGDPGPGRGRPQVDRRGDRGAAHQHSARIAARPCG